MPIDLSVYLLAGVLLLAARVSISLPGESLRRALILVGSHVGRLRTHDRHLPLPGAVPLRKPAPGRRREVNGTSGPRPDSALFFRPLAVFANLMFLYSAAVFPQTNNRTNATIFTTADQQCPVSVNAKLDQRGVLLSAEGKEKRTDGPSLHLIVNKARARQIVWADVIVHGYPKGGRVAPAVVLHPDPDDVTMRFPLTGPIVPVRTLSFIFR
jgi:hypothetical protein